MAHWMVLPIVAGSLFGSCIGMAMSRYCPHVATAMFGFFFVRGEYLYDMVRDIIWPDIYDRVKMCALQPYAPRPYTRIRGIIVFFHGVGSSGWQWRNVVHSMMTSGEFDGYAFYTPTLLQRGNTDSAAAAANVAYEIARYVNYRFIVDKQPMDIILVSTSMGSRISILTETLLTRPFYLLTPEKVRRTVHVCISGFLGALPLAVTASRIGILRWLPFHTSLLAASVDDSDHEEILNAWLAATRQWTPGTAHYMFMASEHDELIPVSAAIPKVSAPYISSAVTHGVDHASMPQVTDTTYIPWILSHLPKE